MQEMVEHLKIQMNIVTEYHEHIVHKLKKRTTAQYINHIIKKQHGVVNKTLVQMLEDLGYNIELIYIKRDD